MRTSSTSRPGQYHRLDTKGKRWVMAWFRPTWVMRFMQTMVMIWRLVRKANPTATASSRASVSTSRPTKDLFSAS